MFRLATSAEEKIRKRNEWLETFDCVEMKNKIQEKMKREFSGFIDLIIDQTAALYCPACFTSERAKRSLAALTILSPIPGA